MANFLTSKINFIYWSTFVVYGTRRGANMQK